MEEKNKFDAADINENKGMVILMSVLPVLFFLPLVTDKKNSPYMMHFANTTLLLAIIGVTSGVVMSVLGRIPLIGGLLSGLFSLAFLALYIINLINAANGNNKPFPIIGNIVILK